MFRFLRKLFTPRQARSLVKRPRRFQPILEALEDRWAPAILTVNSLADSTAAGNALTLREAVNLVDGTLGRSLTAGEQAQVSGTLGSNDTIQFNLPSGPQTITLTGGALSLTKNVTINGPGASNLTINGNNQDRDFLIGQIWSENLNLKASLSGLTISGGNNVYGAGLLNFGTLTVNNCVISNNAAGTSGGGGIYNVGSLTMSNSSLTGNSCGANTDGGGIYNLSSGTATLTNCTLSNNSAGGTGSSGSQGGGAFNSGTMNLTGCTFNGNSAVSDSGAFYTDATATVTSCAFTNNTSGADGGAIHSTGALTISYCEISGNYAASSGGGMENSGIVGSVPNSLTITNTTIANNTSGGTAAGFVNWDPNATLTNVTITGNKSGSSGGGIWAPTSFTLQNSIVAGNFMGNTANDISGTINSSSSYNLIGTGGSGGLTNGVNHNQVGVTNPGLGTLANNGGPNQTIALLAGSPAIDKGNNALVTAGATDQRGLTRIVNGTVDIGAYEVQAPSAASFTVTGLPSSIQAGTAGTITVTAKTASGTVATGYLGTVAFTSSDLQAVLPANYTFVAADKGVHTFSVTLKTAGSQKVTVTDSANATVTGTQSGITVTPAATSSFTLAGFPNPTTAGVGGSFTVTAVDAYGNTTTGYLGTVVFTSSDSRAVLPANYTFVAADKGVHTFSATFKTTGMQTITATDKTTSSIKGTHGGITVNPAALGSFTVAGFPSPTTAGVAGTFTVTAFDTFGNVDTTYAGTVHFTSSDARAVLPTDYTFVAADNGAHPFSATFKTAGTQTITATDKATAIAATHTGITINPATIGSLVLAGFPSPITAGVAGTFTVTAYDTLGNIATGYTGTVHFTSTDAKAVLPADYTFVAADKGVHTFSTTFKTTGTQTITATDKAASSVNGTHSGITVNPGALASFTVAGFPSPTTAGIAGTFTVTAFDAFGNVDTTYSGTVHFTSTDAKAVLPADYTFVTADKGAHSFSATFLTAGTQTITATDKATSIKATHTGITVNPSPTGPVQLVVNSTADNTTADNVLTLREAIAYVDGTLGRSLTAGESAQISSTTGPNDVIQFGLPSGPQTITLTGGALDITAAVAINGPSASNLTINGNNADRVFIVGHDYSQNLSLQVSINGLTITGGLAVASGKNYGGGLLNFGTLSLSNDTFTSNTAGNDGGGAIYNDGAITITGSTFTSNAVTDGGPGGAIQNATPATLTVRNSTFTQNTATGGASGAAMANSGQLTVSGCTITDNSADSNAGGIYNAAGATLNVSTTTVANNSSGADGGGIDNDGTTTVTSSTISGNSTTSEGGGVGNKGTLTLTNCTLYGNTAVSDGGGLQSSGSTVTVTNCTITANSVTSGTGSITGGGVYAVTPLQLFNTIVAGNFFGTDPNNSPADDIAGTVDSTSANNLIGTGGSGGLSDGVNGNQVGVSDAGLGTLDNNGGPTQTVMLLAYSSAIGQGSTAYVTAGETDQRGLARVVNGAVDIGAVEVQVTTTAPADQSGTTGVSTSINLGSFADANLTANLWTVDINWGDGSADTVYTTTQQGSLGNQTYAYQAPGTYTVTVTITDANNDSTQLFFNITIS
jgi:predicted outer membrane repeat protein